MSYGLAAGTLWLIPTPLGEGSEASSCLPRETAEVATRLDYFIAENARSARAFLKQLPLERPIQSIEIRELNVNTPDSALSELLAPIVSGRDGAILSEAGCPAIADPGADLVALAHRHKIRVRPLIGPSSILLALMASGLGGQRFSFAGYLPQAENERLAAARDLEQRSARNGETILIIETPYRNQALFDTLLDGLQASTRLMVAASLTLTAESVEMKPVSEWRANRPSLARVPTVFGWLAEAGPGRRPPAGAVPHRAQPRRR